MTNKQKPEEMHLLDIDKEIYNDAKALFKRFKVYFVTPEEKAKLSKFMFGYSFGDKDVAQARLNPNIVGHSAFDIAKEAGFKVPEDISI